MVDELAEKNGVLKENINLLHEKIHNLEYEKVNKHIQQYSEVARRASLSASAVPAITEPAILLSPVEFLTVRSSQFQRRQQPKSNNNIGNKSVVSPIVSEITANVLDGTDSNAAKIAANGNNKRRRKNLGTGSADLNFEGGDRRAWIYLNRVKRTATEDIITNFVKQKDGFETAEITVKEIPTAEDRLKTFLVIGPLQKRNELYNNEFWPKNVGVKRFHFDKHKDFLSEHPDLFSKSPVGDFL